MQRRSPASLSFKARLFGVIVSVVCSLGTLGGMLSMFGTASAGPDGSPSRSIALRSPLMSQVTPG